MKKQRKINKKKLLLFIIMLLFFFMFLLSIIKLIFYLKDNSDNKKIQVIGIFWDCNEWRRMNMNKELLKNIVLDTIKELWKKY